MKVYTVQIAQHRLVKEMGLPLFDITLKSGNRAFSPDSSLLHQYKRNHIGPDEYTSRFYGLMRTSYKVQEREWDKLLDHEEVALACYCRAGCFCHRYLMVDILRKICERAQKPFEYMGEITADGIVDLSEHITHLSP